MSGIELLEAENAEMKADLEAFKNVLRSTFKALNLIDEKTGLMVEKTEIMPNLLKAGGQIIADAQLSSMPVIGRAAEKRIDERFGFFKDLEPLLKKYA